MKKRFFRTIIANVLIIAIMLGQVAQVTATEAITSDPKILTPTTAVDSIQNERKENIQQQTAQASTSTTQTPTTSKSSKLFNEVGTQVSLSSEQLISSFGTLSSTGFEDMLNITPGAITTTPAEVIEVTPDISSVIKNDITVEKGIETPSATPISVTITTPSAIQMTTLAAGAYHSLQIKGDGTVWAWGDNRYGQLGDGTTTTRTVSKQVKGLTDVVAVVAGDYHSIALKYDGTVWAWGSNYSGQLGNGTTERSNEPIQVKGLSDVISITAGENHCIALKSDGTVWAWGNNESGQLGDGTTSDSSIPIQIKELNDISQILAGGRHSLALKKDGTVWTWGNNSWGQLGNGTTTHNNKPFQIKELSNVSTVLTGGYSNFAIKLDGTLWSWGYNYYGQLGDGTNKDSTIPVQVKISSDLNIIAAGYHHCVAIKNDGTVWVWGDNLYGQLGDGTNTKSTTPVQVESLTNITALVASYHNLAQKSDGTLLAWGKNDEGQLGDSTKDNRSIPILSKDVIAPTVPTKLSASVEEKGVVLSWTASTDEDQIAGYDIYLNDAKLATVTGTTYTDISDINEIRKYKVRAFDASGNFSQEAYIELSDTEAPSAPINLKVTSQTETTVSLEWEASTDNVLVEGYRVYRNGVMVGDSKITSFTDNAPHNATHTYNVRAYDEFNLSEASNTVSATTGTLKALPVLAGGYDHSLQVRNDGTVWAWGSNYDGQLGDGTRTSKSEPVQVKNLSGITAVAAGQYHSLAVKNDGTVWVWGYNSNGQLGIGSRDVYYYTDTPLQIKDLVDITAIAAGSEYSIALRNDRTVWAWGRNDYGQLGDETTTTSFKPVQVKNLTDVIAISAGKYHAIALKSDGTVWAWGKNSYGQLGNETTVDSTKPVQVKGLSEVIAIDAGDEHNIVLKSDGTAYTWGNNSYGLLGNGTDIRTSQVVQVQGLSDIISVFAGNNHNLVLKNDGTVWAWGDNYYGQLGDETNLASNKPVKVKDLSDVSTITVGDYHSLAMKTDGTVCTWGSNWNGQLGDGTKANSNIPVYLKDIYPPSIPTQLSAVIKDSSIVLKWTASIDNTKVVGYEVYRDGVLLEKVDENTYTDTFNIQLDKTYVYTIYAYDGSGNLSEASSIAVNDTEAPSVPSNLKITSKTNTMVCLKWDASIDNVGIEGYEVYRNSLKIGETKQTSYSDMLLKSNETYIYTVKAYDKSSNFSKESSSISVTTDLIKSVTLAAGESQSLQVQEDGSVRAWGYNYNGQLGDGTTISRTVSTQVNDISDIVAVSAAYRHSIALKADGTVWAWGINSNGELGDGSTIGKSYPVQVTNLSDVIAIDAGQYHSIALKNDGTVWTWGENDFGQLGVGTNTNSSVPVQVTGLSDVIAIAAGYSHSLAVKSDGTVWAWGYNSYGQLGDGTCNSSNLPIQVQNLKNVIGVAAGSYYSLAIKNDGTVWAWGYNGSGQLGVGTTNYKNIYPLQIKELNNVIALSSFSEHSLALRSDGTVWAWGYNYNGQLGDGTYNTSYKPIMVNNLLGVTSIAAGSAHSLALKSDGTVWAWGYNSYGQLGDGTYSIRNLPVISKDVTAPTVPTNPFVTIDESGVILTWTGSQDGYKLAGYEIYRDDVKLATLSGTVTKYIDNTFTKTNMPPQDNIYVYKIKAFDAFNNISEAASIILDTKAPSAPLNLKLVSKTATTVSLEWEAATDNVSVEGYIIYRNGVKVGESKALRYTDLAVPHNTSYIYTVKAYDKCINLSEDSNSVSVTTDSLKTIPLATSTTHSLKIYKDGTVWAWGDNTYGKLGDGTSISHTAATKVKGIQDVVAVAAGNYHSMSLKNDGTVWTWGYNNFGQLGNGGYYSTYYLPTQVKELSGIVSIAAGCYYSLALKSDGSVWAWGNNSYGQIGNNTSSDSYKPVQVKDLSDVIAIAAGEYHSVALKNDGTLWTWGYNNYGQLGDGSNTIRRLPIQVNGISNAVNITAGYYHSVAIKSDGTVWAWGYNGYGQLGDGTTTSRNIPVQVKDLIGATEISAGYQHSVALKSDGTVWAWGYNGYGQLGDGTTSSYIYKPVQVKDLSDVVTIASRNNHNLAIKSDEAVWAWGNNDYGQLGDGTKISRSIPVLSKDTIAPTMPTNLSVIIKENSAVLTWTASTDGDYVAGYEVYRDDVKINIVTDPSYTDNDIVLDKIYVYKVKAFDGTGNTSEEVNVVLNDKEAPSTPLNLKLISKTATTVSLEWEASYDNVWVEGYEIYRNGEKIGTSKVSRYTDLTVPHNATHTYIVRAYDKSNNKSEESNMQNVTTEELKSITLAAGASHSLQVQKDGTVWAWGNNSYGQLGDGTTTTRTVSKQVKGINDVVAVAASQNRSMALKNDGTVWTWGYNSVGQLVPGQVTGLYDVVSIAAGAEHSLALKSDGTVWAWGYNGYGLGDGTTSSNKPVQVKDLSNVIAITAGFGDSFAIKSDGTVWAWGNNYSGKLGDGTSTSRSTPVQVKDLTGTTTIVAGGNHTIALKIDGTVWAWGNNSYGQLGDGTSTEKFTPTQVKDLIDTTAITAGESYTIAIKSDGTVWTWGNNSYGQLGNETYTNRNIPVQTKGLVGSTAIAAGNYHSLALKNDGTVCAWGYNGNGQLGDGTTINRSVPVFSKDITAPTRPTNLTAIIKENSTVLAWTASTDGDYIAGYEIYRNDIKVDKLTGTTYTDNDITLDEIYVYKVKAFDGSGNMSEEASVVLNDIDAPSAPINLKVISNTATTVSLEWEASNDNVWVEGYDIYRDGVKVGESKDVRYTDLTVPHNSTHVYMVKAYDKTNNKSEESNTQSITTDALKSIPLATGESHSLQVQKDGTVWAWGYNSYGQLGDGTNTSRTVSTQVKEIQGIVAVAAGKNYSIALKNDGTVWAWGYNGYGQLGDGTTNSRYVPTQVNGLYDVVSIAAGAYHSLALKSDGTVWACGNNDYGELGNGTTIDSLKNVQVMELSGVIAIAAGANYSLALKSDGTLWSWGYNGYGRLGDGTTVNRNLPVQVKGLSNTITIAAGSQHSVALKSDGTVWSWGYNYYAQLGDSTTTNRNLPVQVKGLSNAITIAAGYQHSVAIKSDGTVWAWGYNGYGQLGDGTFTGRSIPVQVMDLIGATTIMAGGNHTIALKNEGTVWSWGYNNCGQLGDGTYINRNKPVTSLDTNAPTVPTNLIARSTDKTVSLTWSVSYDGSGVTGYKVYRDGENIATVTQTTYEDSDITVGNTYIYTVKAFDAAGNISEASNSVVNDTQVPTIPTDISVISKTVASITLTWTASSDNVAVKGYEIYRDGSKVGTTEKTSYTDTGLKPDTNYIYSIKAFDTGYNYSLQSEDLNETTYKDTTAPSVPKNVYIYSGNDTEFSLSWGASTDDAYVEGYEVYRDSIRLETTKNTYYTDTGLKPGMTYIYTIRAFDSSGNVSLESVPLTIADDYGNTIQTAIAIQLGNDIPGNINYQNDIDYLSFVAPAEGNYTISCNSNSGDYKYMYLYDNKGTGLDSCSGYYDMKLEKNLSVNKTYYVRIHSNNISKYSVKVILPSDTEKPSAPTGLSAISKTESTVTLGWKESTDNIAVSGYKIYRDDVEILNSINFNSEMKFTDTHLEAGKTYKYVVKSYDAAGNISPASNEVSVTIDADTIAPSTPTGLIVTGKTATSISLSWIKSTDNAWVKGYVMFKDGERIGTTESTTFTHVFTASTKSYNYTVKAYDISGNMSEASDAVVCDNTSPAMVKDIEVVLKTASRINLSWGEPEDNVGVISYQVYRGDIRVGTTTDRSFTDTALLPETDYTYIIRAVDAAGNVSEPSEGFKVRTEADTTPPAAPLNVNLVLNSATSITLAWTATTDDVKVAGYQIYRDGNKLGAPTNMTTFTDSQLEQNTNYIYTVRAIDTSGNESEDSKAVVLDRIAPTKPENLAVASRGASIIIITWTKSIDNVAVAGYEVYRNGKKIGTVTNNTYTDIGLQLNETYIYTVKAFDTSKNISNESDSLEVTTTIDTEAPLAPTDLKISARTGSTITLEWTASTDNTGVAKYEIYRNAVYIGSSITNSYTDTGLKVGTTYSYTIKALDASENSSNASTPFDAIPLKPEILKVSPLDLDVIGGAVSQELRVYINTSGARAVSKATFEYSIDGTNWITIIGPKSGPIKGDSYTQYFSCLWDLVPMNTGNYKIRYTVYDASDAVDTKMIICDIDKNSPLAPKNLKADSAYGDVQLTWECSTESDVAGYKIYRAESETDRFIPVGEITGRTLNAFKDNSVKLGKTYYFKVTALDKFKQESEFSNVVAVSVIEDNIVPAVISISPASGKIIGSSTTLVVKAEDNVFVSTIKLQYSIDDGQTWVDIASINTEGTGKAEFKWTTPEIDGEVLLRAIAVDKAGNESDGTPQCKYIIDRKGPSKVEGLSKVEYSNSVVLRWNDVEDSDFSYFEVERKDSLNGAYKRVGSVNDTLGMQIKGLSCDSTYWFRVVGYDNLGNRGTPSDEIKVVTLSDLIAPVITSIGPAPGYYSNKIELSAKVQDNAGVQTFSFQISSDMKVWNDIITIQPEGSPTQTTLDYQMDISGINEGTYYIRGIATDKVGNSNNSAFVQYIIDHTSPKQPENLKASPSYSYNKLEWNQNSESDLEYYNVYRSITENETFTLISNKVYALGYIDRDVTSVTKYYYRVTAVDRAGNESVASGSVDCTLLNMVEDTEKPRIITMSPNADTMLPANPTIGLLVQDNFKVAKVTLKYRLQGESDSEWKSIGECSVGKYSEIVSFSWNTAGLCDGNYTIRALAVDEAGNESDATEANYKLNIEAPALPQVTVVPGDFKVDLSWTSGEESDLAGFLIYRSTIPNSTSDYTCINQTRGYSYTDNEVKAGETYYYMVRAMDIRGNNSWSNEVQANPTGNDLVLPIAVAGEEQTVILGMEVELDGRGSYDNNRIESYEWDFGDGYTATVARTTHTYEKEGTYIVTLTVYDPAGNEGTNTTKINVVPADKACGLEIKVADESSGAPISDAKVLVQFTDNTVKEFISNSMGVVKFAGAEGNYKLFAYKNGYNSVEGEALLKRGITVQATLSLKNSPIIVGELKVKRMTLDEIVNKGIDVNAVENQWVYECNVVLGFRPYTIVVNGKGEVLRTSGGGGGGGGWYYNDTVVYPKAVTHPQHPEVPPTIYYLVIPTKTSWLKEFFEVNLVLQNTSEAGSPFIVTNSTAGLRTPIGLTFIPSDYSRNTLVEIGSINPGETKETKWILRGDKKGEYKLEAEFNGILQPFGEQINAVYIAKEPVKVWGEDALVMHVKAEDIAFKDELYLAKIELENVSDTELYNVSFEVKEGGSYTLSQEYSTSMTFEMIKPGETKVFEVWLIPSFTGKLDLSESFILKTGGNATIKTTFESIPAPKALLNVTTEASYKEMEGDYYCYDIIAKISNWRDTAGNVKAELEWTGTEGIKDIQISESKIQELGDFTSNTEKQVIWNVKFKSASKTATLDYVINVSGENARSKKASGTINVGDAKLGILLSFKEATSLSTNPKIKYYTINAKVYNSGGVAKNGKAELKILSHKNAENVYIISDIIQELGTFETISSASWDIWINVTNLADITELSYQVTASADNAESVTEIGDLEDDYESNNLIKGEFQYTSGKKSHYDATFYYNDNYFSNNSSIYNHNLGTMSLCFAMSAFGCNCTTYGNQSMHAKELLEKVGFEEFDTNLCYQIKPTTDSIGVLAANKKVRFNGEQYTLIAVAIRGGGYEREWSSNFTIGLTGQHQGFSKAKSDVLAYLNTYIANKEISGNIKLWITGFSRAAATTNLVAGALNGGASLGSTVTLKPSNLYAYCFEAPAGELTTEVQSKPIYTNIHNIINLNDPVTKVAPKAMGFMRYGTDHYLPSVLTTEDYSIIKGIMVYNYKKLEGTGEYIVDDFKMKKVDLNKNDNSPWEYEKSIIINDRFNKTTQAEFLDSLINDVSKQLLKSRLNYVNKYQSGVREIFSSREDEKFEDFLKILMEKIKNNSVALILRNDREKLIMEYARQSQFESGVDCDIYVIEQLLKDLLTPLFVYGVTNLNKTVTAAYNSGGFGAAHYPDLCLAWMMAMDDNYTPFAKPLFSYGSHRTVKANCPVDVNVYNNSGVLVASIKSDEPQEIAESSIVSSVNEDGEKIVYLPADADYRIEIVATDDGKVNYSVSEYNSSVGDVTRIINYYDVDIKKDDVLTSEIPAFSSSELEDSSENGSSVEYTLKSTEGEVIVPDAELSGTAAAEAFYIVDVLANNDKYGVVTGQGIRQLGEFAKVTAQPYIGYKFSGWYADNECVSTDTEYRFCVTKDETLIAKFNMVDPTVVDTFEYDGSDYMLNAVWGLNNTTGSAITLELTDDSNRYLGKNGLAFNYSLTSSNGYVGITKSMDGADWSDKNAIQLWTKPDGQKQDVVVQITSAGNVFEVNLNDYAEYLDSTEPVLVTIPFSSFVGKDDSTAVFDPTSIDSFGLGCKSIVPDDVDADTYKLDSVIYYDEVKAVSSDVSKVTFKTLTSTIKPGDVNDDGAVDSIDYALLKMYLLKESVKINLKNADFDQDGSVDSIDYAKLNMFLLR